MVHSELLKTLLTAFFPKRCPVCDKIITKEKITCPNCRPLILHSPDSGEACAVCGLSVYNCGCRKGRIYSKIVFPFRYEGKVKSSLYKMKFRGRADLIKGSAAVLYESLCSRGILTDTDIITFVPMTEKHERKRGYNQAKVLADEIGRRSGIPVIPLLYKISDSETQHELKLLRRSGNLLGAFEPFPDAVSLIKDKNILVLDDIITSGNTLNEIAKTLLIFSANEVYCAVVAARILDK